MKNVILFILFVFSFYSSKSQETKLIGNWEGALIDANEKIVWNIRIKVLSATSAELHLYDKTRGNYFNYLTDTRFEESKRTVTFKAIGNLGVMTVTYNSAYNIGQSVYNLRYNEKEGNVTTIWSDLNLSESIENENLCYAILISDKVKTYKATDITIGGKSFDNIGIDKVEFNEKVTKVTITIKNNTDDIYKGTLHEPASITAFYLTDADREKKYNLTGANVKLPYELSIQPGKTILIVLYFEPMPLKTKLFNMQEKGSSDATNLWKFYDIFLK
jgi:hypothetical protein